MKKFLLFVLVLLAGCAGDKLEIPKAKEVAEKLIVALDKGDYPAIANYYSPDFNAGEPVEERTKKLETLKKIMGNITSFQLIDSASGATTGQELRVMLKYKIQHTKVTSIETFNIVYEEGSYRISAHDVRTDNL